MHQGVNSLLKASLFGSATLLLAPYDYGDTVTVETLPGTVISPGWAIIREAYSGPRFYTPHFRTHAFMTLVYLNGGPVGDVIEVLGRSPIPPGWEKIATRGNQGLDRGQYNLRYRIEKKFEAGYLTGTEAMPPVTCQPLELDVAALDLHRADPQQRP